MEFTAISVDDEQINHIIINELSKKLQLIVTNFLDANDAVNYIKQNNSVDIAFVDYMMPQMTGDKLVEEIRKIYPTIPIVMITGHGEDKEVAYRALEAGATEFLTKPIDSTEFITRIKNLLNLRKAQILLSDRAKLLAEEVRLKTLDIVDRERETLVVLAKAAEHKDPETANHLNRVAYYSKLIAEGLNKGKEFEEIIFYSSPLHDIGKIGIEDSILFKKGKLTPEEYEKMKTHTTIGYDILSNSKSKYLQAGAIIALTHHENFDGSGYPNGLKGEDINIYGRIVTIADVYDALINERPYKEPWSTERAINILKQDRNKKFDPRLLDMFLDNIDKVSEITKMFNS